MVDVNNTGNDERQAELALLNIAYKEELDVTYPFRVDLIRKLLNDGKIYLDADGNYYLTPKGALDLCRAFDEDESESVDTVYYFFYLKLKRIEALLYWLSDESKYDRDRMVPQEYVKQLRSILDKAFKGE